MRALVYLLLGFLLGSIFAYRVDAQNPAVIFGVNSGVPTAIQVDASGNLNVKVN